MTDYLDQSSTSPRVGAAQKQSEMNGATSYVSTAPLAGIAPTQWSAGIIRYENTIVHATTTQLQDGGYVIVFSQEDYSTGPLRFILKAVIFNADGSQRGSDFLLGNPALPPHAKNVKAVTLSNGYVAIAWQDNGTFVQVFDPYGSYRSEVRHVAGALPNDNEVPYQMFATGAGFTLTYKDPDDGKHYYATFTENAAPNPNLSSSTLHATKDFSWATVSAGINPSANFSAALRDGAFGIQYARLSLEDHPGKFIDVSFGALGAPAVTEIEMVRNRDGAFLIWVDVNGKISGQHFVINYTPPNGGFPADYAIVKNGSERALGTANGSDYVMKALHDGRMVLTWVGGDQLIHAMVLNENGSIHWEDFIVSPDPSNPLQSAPSISVLQDGRFIISWDDDSVSQGQTNSARDTKIYDARTAAVNVTGRQMNDSWLYGTAHSDTLNGGTKHDKLYGEGGADTLIGGSGNDTLTGGAGNDSLVGGNDNDMLFGGEGADTLDGGDGYDYVSYADYNNSQGVIASLDPTIANGKGATGDRYTSIEGLLGSGYADILYGDGKANALHGLGGDDTIYGGSGNDELYGHSENDVLIGGVGADHLSGGIGNDFASYDTAGGGVEVDLGKNVGKGSDAEGDTYDSIEGLIGSNSADKLIGDSRANELRGGGGNDTLVGGAGADTLKGGSGIDWVDYSSSDGAVVVSLTGLKASSGHHATGDVLFDEKGETDIENIIGSSHNDRLVGSNANNTLQGGNGSDTLEGLYGADHLDGGAGIDYADYTILDHNIIVSLLDPNKNTKNGLSDGDTYNEIEGIITGGGNDELYGNNVANTLIGGGGNDTLEGYGGGDHMDGGAGNDFASYASATHNIITSLDPNSGWTKTGDAVGDSYDRIEGLIGGSGNDRLGGDNSGNTLRGGVGNDILEGKGGDDTLEGGNGDDTLEGGSGNDSLDGGVGNDFADYRNSSGGVNVNLLTGLGSDGDAAGDRYVSIEGVYGSSSNDTLTGGNGSNTLYGGGGHDILNGGLGVDVLRGGSGNDTYILDTNDGDIIDESASAGGGGTDDLIKVKFSYSIAENADIENLDASVAAASADIELTGNGAMNKLTGHAGKDTLDGGVGSDTLIGGAGDDTYSVDTMNETVIEAVGGGNDTVIASQSHRLTANSEIETLKAAEGAGDINLFGNDANNTIIGSDGNNSIEGGGGVNSLDGGKGNDILVGTSSASETLSGGEGDDEYYLRGSGPVVIQESDGALGGLDTIYSSRSFTLEQDVSIEVLSVEDAATNTAAINLTGNNLENTLIGGKGDNVLNGGGGADSMAGGEGNDTYYVDDADDVVAEGENGGTRDVLFTSIDYTLGGSVYIEGLRATGAAAANGVSLTGNDKSQIIEGGSGNDVLNGGGGGDTLIGGAGDDTYIISNASDVVDETGDTVVGSNGIGGIDTVRTDRSYSINTVKAANVENLEAYELNGTTEMSLTGNALSNRITGNNGINVLYGGSGDDTLVGAHGNDVLRGGADNDSLEGGGDNDELYGESGDDTLDGGAGDDILDGGEGSNELRGGSGNDTYHVYTNSDKIVERQGEGTNDTIIATNSFILDDDVYVETLVVDEDAGSGIELFGNIRDNILKSNSDGSSLYGEGGNDSLVGGEATDELFGGEGNDTLDGGIGQANRLEGGTGNDTYYVRNAGDTIEDEDGTDDTVYLRTSIHGNRDNAIAYAKDLYANKGIENVYIDDELVKAPTEIRFDGLSIAENSEPGEVVSVLSADDTPGDIHEFYFFDEETSTVSDTDPSGQFSIVQDDDGIWKIVVSLNAKLNHEVTDSYTFVVRVIDKDGLHRDERVTISVDDVNDAPTDIQINHAKTVTVDENTVLIGTMSAEDEDEDPIAGYTVEQPYRDLLEVVRNDETGEFELRVKGNAVLDYEVLGAFIDVSITATDSRGATSEAQTIRIVINNLPDSPSEVDNTYHVRAPGMRFPNEPHGAAGGNDTAFIHIAAFELHEDDGIETLAVYHDIDFDVSIKGNSQDNTIVGGSANDTLLGEGGNDSIRGGEGNDSLNGGEGNDQLEGGAGNDTLVGGAGSDVLKGGLGDDTYYIDSPGDIIDEKAGEGRDKVYTTVNYSLVGTNLEDLTVDPGVLAETQVDLTGNDGKNEVIGHDGKNVLDGGGSNDTLNGGAGDDTLLGGSENDSLNGGEGSDELDGGTGDDTLDGGWDLVADILTGGAGNDIYYVGYGDIVVEDENGGDNDTIYAGAEFRLGNNVWVETLIVDENAGSSVEVYGNVHANTLKANDSGSRLDGGGGNDSLVGGAGADTLIGGEGDDTLEGGAGDFADTFKGGAGNDLYILSNVGDVIEVDGGDDEGYDKAYVLRENITDQDNDGDVDDEDVKIYAEDLWEIGIEEVYIDGKLYSQPDDIDNEYHITDPDQHIPEPDIDPRTGGNDTAHIDVPIFELNDLYGIEVLKVHDNNKGDVSIAGNRWDNTIIGGAANDTLRGRRGNDELDGGEGNDTLYGDEGNDTLYGGAGNDTLDGGENDDWLEGDAGEDELHGGEGNDTLIGGGDNDSLNGDEGNDSLVGGGGTDTLDGGKGDDILIGGTGDDTYFIDSEDDVIHEYEGEGRDKVYTTINYSLLGTHLEDLAVYEGVSGGVRVDLTGNNGDNELTGHDGDNLLDGGKGNDYLYGNDGNDTLLGGEGDDHLDGGSDYDYLIGGEGKDHLNGGTGVDTLDGGIGDDIYYVDNRDDVVIEAESVKGVDGGKDTIYTIRSYTLGAGVYVETLRSPGGTTPIDLMGNEIANTIIGANGNDTLSGDGGDDLLRGLNGNDTLRGGEGNDTLEGREDHDLLEGGSGNDSLFGGSGNDTLIGGEGDDRLKGGEGNDVYLVEDYGDVIEFDNDTDDGYDTVYVTRGAIGDRNDDQVTDDEDVRIYVENLLAKGIEEVFVDGKIYNPNGNGDDIYHVRQSDMVIVEDPDPAVGGNDKAIIFVDYELGHDVGVETLEAGVDTGVSITGNNLDNTIIGGGGNDWLTGGGGNDSIFGGDGDDVLTGGDTEDRLEGGDGNDFLYGGLGKNTLVGGAGDDTYYIHGGLDITLLDVIEEALDGGHDSAYLFKSDFEDENGVVNWAVLDEYMQYLWDNGIEDVYLDGEMQQEPGSADNVYHVTDPDMEFDEPLEQEVGGIDKAYIYATASVFVLDEEDGIETLEVHSSNLNNVSLTGNAQDNTIIGGIGDDTLIGSAGDDKLVGGSGNDSLVGGDDDDYLDGGNGDDTLEGGAGINILFGGHGNDVLDGKFGSNVLEGGAGNDTLYGSLSDESGVSELNGGDGSDVYYVYGSRDIVHDGGDDEGDVDIVHLRLDDWIRDFGNEEAAWAAIDEYAQILFWDRGIEQIWVDDVLYGGVGGGGNSPATAITLTGGDIGDGTVNEDAEAGDVVGVLGNNDPDEEDTFTYRFVGGLEGGAVDALGRFRIVQENGVWRVVVENPELLDHEQGDGTYTVVIEVTDDGEPPRSYEQEVTIVINDVNETGTTVTLTGGVVGDGTVNEDAAVGDVVGVLGNDDPDRNDTFTYTFENGSDVDASGRFRIVQENGTWRIVVEDPSLLDQSGGSHTVVVVVSDGTTTYTDEVTIEVNDVDGSGGGEAPTGVSLSVSFVDELTPTDSIVGRLSQIGGPEGATYTYALLEDDRFYLDGDFIMVKNGILIDFEDVNFYELWVTVSVNGGPPSQPFKIELNVLDLEIENATGGDDTDDVIRGGSQADVLNGGGGNDTLVGSFGMDRLIGGSGSDVFLFDTRPGPLNVDTVADFKVSEGDQIHLARSVFRIGDLGQLSAEAFGIGSEATNEFQRVLYDPEFGWLRVDIDGNGEEEAVTVANIGFDLDLRHTHFYIV